MSVSRRFVWKCCVATLVAAGLAPALSRPVAAQVTSSTEERSYRVPGSTARAIVGYMLRNPLAGDHGAAFANIRPSYRLDLETEQGGRLCRVESVAVSVRFVLTLPVGTDTARMSSKVRAAWNGFAAFARRHEEVHRQSYLGCARAFVNEARRKTAPSCGSLRSEIRSMLSDARRSCEAKQLPFDRQQSSAVRNLALFNMAGY